jgi:hypothetical protein
MMLNIEEQRKQEFEDFQTHLVNCQEVLLNELVSVRKNGEEMKRNDPLQVGRKLMKCHCQ